MTPLVAIPIRAHLQAYRFLASYIEIPISILFKPVVTYFSRSREVQVIDTACALVVTLTNAVSQKTFNPELSKTAIQKRREQEVVRLRTELKGTIYPEFCQTTARYADAIIPRLIGEKLSLIPASTEGWILFRLGYAFRYLNHQILKHYDYRMRFLATRVGKLAETAFTAIKTQVAEYATGRETLNYFIDFEYILLQTCIKLNKPASPEETEKWIYLVTRSLAKSLSAQRHIDLFLEQLKLESREERFIARLTWHERYKFLPESLPNPQTETLSAGNLEEKLDQALYNYLNKHRDTILKYVISKDFKQGVTGLLYFLEGKDLVSNTFSYLIAECGIKQIVDPHLFALAILQSNGVEVMDYELYGFGRRKGQLIFDTGIEMMSKMRNGASASDIINLFQKTGLKAFPRGFEEIEQKQDLKKQLHACISDIIYKMIKSDESFRNPSTFKKVREKIQKLPIIGGATLTLHLMISGTFFAFDYFSQEKDIPFETWMFKKLSGKKLADYVADRIVSLIYHPSWRITIMQLLDLIFQQLENPESIPPIKKEEWQNILHFLLSHFTSVPIPSSIMNSYTFDNTVRPFLEESSNASSSPLEKGLSTLVPIIKELLLYTHLLTSMRKAGVAFDGDAKFFEFFIRETLNRHTACYQRQFPLTNSIEFRTHLIDEFLSLNGYHLWESLWKHPDRTLLKQAY